MNFVKEEEINSEITNKEDEDEIEFKSDIKNTFVGTAEYVSPEVLCDHPAGPETDLWALGCTIYQMFTGFSPFKDKTEYLVFKKILEMNYTFPDSIPQEAQDLIKSLLIVDPTKRLGSGDKPENDFFALKSHPFFKGVDYTEIHRVDPPFKNEFKIKIKQPSLVKSQSSGLDHLRHKNTIQIIKQDVIEKKSPWFHYNTRKVVLDNTPKIEYIDPEKNVVKVNYF
jgi:serine/threonine protein kinase